MTYFSKDAIIKITTTYLKITSRKDLLKPEEVSEEALVEKGLVEDFLRYYGLDGEVDSCKRIRAAVLALSLGVEGDRISRYLDWREFEELSAELFKEAGYTVFRDVKIKLDRKRIQIDLIAIIDSLMLIVDCKHWRKPPAYSERRRIMLKQMERMKALTRLHGDFEIRIIPVVLTLYEPRELIVDGYPYVPIRKIKSFLDGLRNIYPSIKSIKVGISLKELKSVSQK
ncbi:MAG: NERD domain-containing protein [Candidatus Caldarchaeales archaeon]